MSSSVAPSAAASFFSVSTEPRLRPLSMSWSCTTLTPARRAARAPPLAEQPHPALAGDEPHDEGVQHPVLGVAPGVLDDPQVLQIFDRGDEPAEFGPADGDLVVLRHGDLSSGIIGAGSRMSECCPIALTPPHRPHHHATRRPSRTASGAGAATSGSPQFSWASLRRRLSEATA